MIYIVVIILATILAFFSEGYKKTNKVISDLFFFLSGILLFFPLALRGMGVDYDMYVLTYEKAEAMSIFQYMEEYNGRPEILYVLLNYAAKIIFNDYIGVNALCAALSVGITYVAVYYFRKSINLPITIWAVGFTFYMLMYGLNRMMISVAIIFYSYKLFIEKKYKRLALCVIIAGLFHYAAFLMFPFYILINWLNTKNVRKKIAVKLASVFLVALCFVVIYKVVPVIFGGFSWYGRYAQYFNLGIDIASINNNIMVYPLFILLLIFGDRLRKNNEHAKMLISMIYIFVILIIVAVIMPIHRIGYYFYPATSILYGMMFKGIKHHGITENNRCKALYTAIVMCYGLLVLVKFVFYTPTWTPNIIPYETGF